MPVYTHQGTGRKIRSEVPLTPEQLEEAFGKVQSIPVEGGQSGSQTNYAKELLAEAGGGSQRARPSVDYARELLEGPIKKQGPVGGTFQETEEISAITGKPIRQFLPGADPEASFATLLKSFYADKPFTKAKIFSEARGIPVSRYRVGEGGQVEFKNSQGQWQREVSDLGASKLKSFAAEVAGHPGTYLGPAGAAFGPLGAVGGAMGGEILRKGVAKGVYGEEIEPVGDLVDVGLQGIFALGGEMAGKVVSAGINRYLTKRAGILTRAGEEVKRGLLTEADHARAAWIKALADKHEIQLALHQLYDKEGMTNTWKYLRKHPLTSDAVRQFEDKLAESTDRAIHRFVYDMGGYSVEPYALGSGLKGAAEKSIRAAEAGRTAAVSPMYERAFSTAQPVDLAPALKNLDRLIESYPEGSIQRGLLGIKKALTTWSEPGKKVAGEIAEAPSHRQIGRGAGEALIPSEEGTVSSGAARVRVPETDLRKIQKLLFELDDLIEGTSYEAAKIAPSSKKVLNRELMGLKEDILAAAEKSSPEFIAANKEYERLSPPIEKLKKSVIGELSRIEKESVIGKAPRKLLDVENMPDGQLLQAAKREIKRQDPQLWRNMVGGYIRDVYEGLLMTEEGKVANAAGKLNKKLFGSESQRRIMEAAMDPNQFESFKSLMDVFQRAAIGASKESMTAPFLQIQKQVEGELGSKLYKTTEEFAANPLKKGVSGIFGWWDEAIRSKNNGKLLEALTDPDVIVKMAKLKRLTPGSKTMIEELGVFTSLVGEKMNRETP